MLELADVKSPNPGPLHCPECGKDTETADVRNLWSCAECESPRTAERLYEGNVSITWPAPPGNGVPLLGFEAELRGEDGEQLFSAIRAVIHVDPGELIWAEVEAYTDANGRPAKDVHGVYLPPGPGAEPAMATFRYLVSAMSIREGAATG